MAMNVLATVFWALCAAGLAAYAASVTGGITYATLADGRRTERRLPFAFRLLLPFHGNFASLVSGVSATERREEAEKKLAAAGMDALLSGAEFLSLQWLVPIAGGIVFAAATLAVAATLPGRFDPVALTVLAAAGTLYAALYPRFWLRRTIARRHLSIAKSLPFVLDLMTLSVEAGMDFTGALRRCCSRRGADPLNEELLRMLHEIQLGIPRRTAIRNMASRAGQTDLSSVAHALAQADELGVPVAPVLRIQAAQMRSRRFDRAEKLANEAPVKMLGPLLLCIFPAVFIVLLGPVLAHAAKSLF